MTVAGMRTRRDVACFIILLCVCSANCKLRTDQSFWNSLAEKELEDALKLTWNVGVAKNIILFIGDGMGPNTVTATRIYKEGESGSLSFEKFPHIGLLKTYSANKMVPDSSCTATALFTGVKVNQETIGVDATVQKNDCTQSLKPEARLNSLIALAQKAGKSTGLVTTMRVTHATPSPLYAHSANRKWECETSMPKETPCKDIARQLIEDHPGKDINVILGGGKQVLVSNVTVTQKDPIDTWSCKRMDGRDLIEEYKKDKQGRDLKHSVVYNSGQLKHLDVNNTDYLLGIFANSHMQLEFERDQGPDGVPSISEMLEAAIKILEKNKKGYFLMVEGGNIDMSHHRGKAKKAITETAAMDEAVKVAMKMSSEEDTLLIVTSDHTHTLTINGYPLRGTDILGVAQTSDYDGVNYTILSYGTGGPESFQYHVEYDNNHAPTVVRDDPTLLDTNTYDYQQIASIRLTENAHGGGDVVIYARGPHSHLFHNVHEQHYIFHAVAYASKMGAHSAATKHAVINLLIPTLCSLSIFIYSLL